MLPLSQLSSLQQEEWASVPQHFISGLHQAEKIGELYVSTIAYIFCRLSFALLRTSVMCMHGSRSLCSARDEFSDLAMVAVAAANIRH